MADYKIRIKKVSVLKIAYLFSLFGLLSGLILGFALFVFLEFSVLSLGMDVGVGGIILLCFVVVPIMVIILSFVFGLLFGLFFNLFLRLVGGLDTTIEELE